MHVQTGAINAAGWVICLNPSGPQATAGPNPLFAQARTEIGAPILV
jgi:hypothetical protein